MVGGAWSRQPACGDPVGLAGRGGSGAGLVDAAVRADGGRRVRPGEVVRTGARSLLRSCRSRLPSGAWTPAAAAGGCHVKGLKPGSAAPLVSCWPPESGPTRGGGCCAVGQ